MIQRLNINNFFTRYIVDTHAKELSKKDKTIALVASLILGVCTLWVVQAIVAIVRCKLDQREVVVLSMPKLDAHLKTKSKEVLFTRLEKNGGEASYLDLRYMNLTEEEIEKVISLCPNVEKIAIQTDGISKTLVQSVKSLNKLEGLDINLSLGAKPSFKNIKTLRKIPSINRFSLQRTRHSADLAQDNLVKMDEIEEDVVELSLFSKEVTSEELEEKISSSPKLQKLEFQIGKITNKLATKIKKLKFLEVLNIDLSAADEPVLSKEAFGLLMELPKLTTLYIKIPEFSPVLAAMLKNAKKLASLSLEVEKNLTRPVITSITGIVNLTKLSLNVLAWINNQNFLTTLLVKLGSNKTIEDLTMKRLQVLDRRNVESLIKMESLKRLVLPSLKNIDSSALEALGEKSTIETIKLDSFVPKKAHQEVLDKLSENGIHVTTKK